MKHKSTSKLQLGTFIIALFLGVSLSGSAVSAEELISCQTISASGPYTLNQNVNSAETCFTIAANDVELDCNGYTITYSQSAVGYGIDNAGGYNNTVIKNCNIVQGSSNFVSYPIYCSGMTNSTITNNIITTLGDYGVGIAFESSSTNIISNNSITSSSNFDS